MLLSESVSYEGATCDQVFDLIRDKQFRGHVCETIGSSDHDVTVVPDGDCATVTIERVLPADMPDFVKKLTGETVRVSQTERWGPPGDEGGRTADVEIRIVGQPASMSGTCTLRPDGTGSALHLEGEVTVSVPIVGRKVEPEVAKAIVSALRTECTEGTARLRQA